MPESARGAYVFTCLAGNALECVEHIEPSEYRKTDGELVLFKRLDERFPQRDQSDEMSEVLMEIFSLRAAEGEGGKAWISRATEMFDKCRRKVSVSFPEEAQGWLILHLSGMNEEQKAARSLGDLKHESIGRAMCSVYPEFTCAKRRTNAVAVVDSQALDDDGADYDDLKKPPK